MVKREKERAEAPAEEPAPLSASLEALRDLEGWVDRAATELRRLRRENQALREQLDAAERAPGPDAAAEAERNAWQEERDHLRERVDHLSRRLEELLEQIES